MHHWLRSYSLLLRWTGLRSRASLPLNLVVQTCLAVGIIIGFAYLVPEMDGSTALHLATGAPVLGLITVGMVIAPQEVAAAKQQGIADFNRSLPVPRSAIIASDASIALITALPGMIAALVVSSLRFDLDLRISPLIIPAVTLTALAAIGIGYGVGYGLQPAAARMVSQLIVFISLMFSPIIYPASRLPGWLESIHVVLPFQYMADCIREALSAAPGEASALPFLVLSLWTAAGLSITYGMMSRRP